MGFLCLRACELIGCRPHKRVCTRASMTIAAGRLQIPEMTTRMLLLDVPGDTRGEVNLIAFNSTMKRIKYKLVVTLLILHRMLCCPFARSLEQWQEIIPKIVAAENPNAVSRCSKSNFLSPESTRLSICVAYAEVIPRFNGLLDAAVAAPSSIFGSVLRLLFHDAGEVEVTNPTDFLGPDGCLANDGSSDGLTGSDTITMKFLEPIWQSVCDRISRADFWAMLGYIVLQRTILPPIPMMFHYGRHDNVECEGGAGRLPHAEGNLSEVHRVFVQQMGLTFNDAVTLMGAHSLGHTHIEVSGYGFRTPPGTASTDLTNAWDHTPAVLDNDYYIMLLQSWKGFLAEDSRLHQWRHRQETFIMLSPDIALAYPLDTDFPVSSDGLRQKCHVSADTQQPVCKRPASDAVPTTYELCRLYAQDNNAFQRAFVDAYQCMVTVGYGLPENRDGATAKGKLGTLTAMDLETCSLQ